MRVLIVIPARGGSTRVPRKNMQVVGGMTLVSRACEKAAVLVSSAGRVQGKDQRVRQIEAPRPIWWVCSTDDAEVLDEVDQYYGSLHRTVRTGATAGDGPMAPVLLDAATQFGGEADTVMCLQPTSPLANGLDFIHALEAYANGQKRGLVGGLLGRQGARSLVSVNADTGQRNGAIYITRVEMLRDGLVFDDDSLKYPMPASRSLDINTPEDLEEARRILGGTT